MKEYDIYLPMTQNDGTPADAVEINRVKETLAKQFGGYTHFRHRNEGAWSVGGVTFRDEVTMVRVLDDGSAGLDMRALKKSLENSLRQETILIVERQVEVVS